MKLKDIWRVNGVHNVKNTVTGEMYYIRDYITYHVVNGEHKEHEHPTSDALESEGWEINETELNTSFTREGVKQYIEDVKLITEVETLLQIHNVGFPSPFVEAKLINDYLNENYKEVLDRIEEYENKIYGL